MTRVFAIIVIAIAVLVLWGWQYDIVSLKRILPEMTAMNPMTAVSFILCGFSLVLCQQKGYKLLLAKSLAACGAM